MGNACDLSVYHHHHHHKHQGLDPLIRSVSRVTTAPANVLSVYSKLKALSIRNAPDRNKKRKFGIKIDNKYINVLENASSGSSVVPWEQTDGRTDRNDEAISLLAFNNFGNSPKKETAM
jgi:hypothetical protein